VCGGGRNVGVDKQLSVNDNVGVDKHVFDIDGGADNALHGAWSVCFSMCVVEADTASASTSTSSAAARSTALPMTTSAS